MPVWAYKAWVMEYDVTGLPLVLGMIQFCFIAHSAVPSIYSRMEQPDLFPLAMSLAFFFSGAFHALVGLGSLCALGARAQPSFAANLGRDLEMRELPGLGHLRIAATVGVLVSTHTTFRIFAKALVKGAKRWFGWWTPHHSRVYGEHWGATAGLRAACVGVAAAGALALRDGSCEVKAFIGSCFGTCTCLLLPFAFALKVHSHGLHTKAINWVGLFGSVYILCYGAGNNALAVSRIVTDPVTSNSTAYIGSNMTAQLSSALEVGAMKRMAAFMPAVSEGNASLVLPMTALTSAALQEMSKVPPSTEVSAGSLAYSLQAFAQAGGWKQRRNSRLVSRKRRRRPGAD